MASPRRCFTSTTSGATIDFAGLDADAEAALYYERYFDLAALDGKLASFAAARGGRRRAGDRRGRLHLARADGGRGGRAGGADREPRRGAAADSRARPREGTHGRRDQPSHRAPLLPGAGALPRRVRRPGPRRRRRRQRGLAPPARRPLHVRAISRAHRAACSSGLARSARDARRAVARSSAGGYLAVVFRILAAVPGEPAVRERAPSRS